MNDFLFEAGFVDQAEAALRQVTQTAMEQAAGTAARSGGEIVLFDQPDAEAAHGGVAGNPGADNTPADNQQVQWRLPKLGQRDRALWWTSYIHN
jgi:hypothetical protein